MIGALRRRHLPALHPHEDHRCHVRVGGDVGLAVGAEGRCRRPGRRRGSPGTASRAAKRRRSGSAARWTAVVACWRWCNCCWRLSASPLPPARSWPACPPTWGVRGDRRAAPWSDKPPGSCAGLRRHRLWVPPHEDHSYRVRIGGENGRAVGAWSVSATRARVRAASTAARAALVAEGGGGIGEVDGIRDGAAPAAVGIAVGADTQLAAYARRGGRPR